MIPKVLNYWHSENDEHIYMDYSGNAYKVTKIKYVPSKDEKVIKFVNIDWSRALVFKNRLWKYFKQVQLTKLKTGIELKAKDFRFGANTKHRG